jgi:hypothetical protein
MIAGSSQDGTSAEPGRTSVQLNPQQRLLVERAISFIRTMAAIGSMAMDGEDPQSYERLLRLQELMGIVERGVGKDLIDAQCPDHAVDLAHPNLACPICLDQYEADERMRTLPCAHSYHMLCIDKWLASRNTCPICRQEPIKRPPPSTPSV